MKLTLGPLLFHWMSETRRDFYFRMADESPYDTVHLGEVVCAKRSPFFENYLPEVAERLQKAGKEVVLSTLALITNDREQKALAELCAESEFLIEANDLSTIELLSGKPHVIGPYVNVFNEATLAYLGQRGAVRLATYPELTKETIGFLAASRGNVEIEVTVFGKLPLSVSARCYHARAHGFSKDSCQYVCGNDKDGKEVETLDHQSFLAINGTQTVTFGYSDLSGEISGLKDLGVTRLRANPHSCDMVAVGNILKACADAQISGEEAALRLEELLPDASFINGYYKGGEGMRWTEGE